MAVDPSRLLVLLAIREQGSVTRAAEQTGRTPPAVSQQLARLEAEVGAQLVERLPHGARLTPLGTRLADHAERIADAVRRADAETADYLDRHRNRLRLGAFPTAGLALLPDVLAALRHRHPDAELSVVDLGPVEGMALVGSHELDLALVGEYGTPLDAPPGVRLAPLIDDPVHAVLPTDHRLADHPAVRLADFADEPWAAAPRTLPNRRQLEEATRAQGFLPNVPFESESYAVAEAVVSAGVAVAFIPRLAISGTSGTVHRPLAEPGLFRRIHAVVPASAGHAPLTEVCLRLLENLCAELAERFGG
ncbi:DNA-binding transcriptional LysR family regulator [Saccharopolyspora erythraea NRRL 2338]|uniref:LysR-family transcriptional regulator n=2 Tax=Saccharopolyspora erythraea TaxID=1836 RepID=A4FN23_SACEN|nr:LysR family transcriptional regulator [Saccharopolyspora erythraea]PFG99089.1 DNA-binding transcriptional LysR family regulator [Saccharopolyspora erythraea NRRL 2338]QRK89050.1 LysR family transcriptional regulator [Saccharopolyspora erythraea]CAM05448.1 LysR-family transcriptional regulator [Saccharopolyspora erythraea NRRL 2338]